jgi:hypothetical protein
MHPISPSRISVEADHRSVATVSLRFLLRPRTCPDSCRAFAAVRLTLSQVLLE